MKTIIYLIRHSIPQKNIRFQRFMNEKQINNKVSLTEKGKQLALFKLYNPEYKDVDYIYSSEYLRALQTAEILSNIINKEIIKDQRFNERFRGKGKIENNYEKKQFNDINYKLKKGESQDDVSIRMYNGINDILNKHKSKKIAVFTHSTAITFLLKKWCNIQYLSDHKFNENIFFSGKIDYVQGFKLIFENNNLTDISVVKNNYKVIEVGYILSENIEHYKQILKNKNIENNYNVCTKDVYYSKLSKDDLRQMDEERIKENCIRIRMNKSINKKDKFKILRVQNYEKLLNIFKEDFYSFKQFTKIEKKLMENDFNRVIETYKYDYQYMNGYLQLQDIENIGLIIYYYNPKYIYLDEEKQKQILTQEIKEFGFEFDNLEKIDKLKKLLDK